MKRSLWLLIGIVAFPAFAQEEITLDEYLKEVRTKNEAVTGAVQSSEGGAGRSKEAQLPTALAVFSEFEASSDSKLPVMPFFLYDRIDGAKYTLGLKKTFSFGFEAKAYYLFLYTHYINPRTAQGAMPPVNFFDARPTVEFSQSLWSNGFGRGTRAREELMEAGAMAKSFVASHTAKMLISTAEELYWGLALARERKEVALVAKEQAKKIYDWNAERVRRNLADEVDALQAKAAMEASELEYQTAVDGERQAARQFNKFRNVNSDEVKSELLDVEADKLLARTIPDIQPQRDDVRAAEQEQRAAIAEASAARESYRPTLDVYGMLGLNGRDPALGLAFTNPFQANRPSYTVGLRFNMPLDRSLASEAMAGVHKQQIGAEMTYRQKQNDLLQDWQDLGRRIKELKQRMRLAQTISKTQKLKLERERNRLTTGRTTTFQVLSFEQDYARSKLSEIGIKLELVRALTQLKLYGGNS